MCLPFDRVAGNSQGSKGAERSPVWSPRQFIMRQVKTPQSRERAQTLHFHLFHFVPRDIQRDEMS